MPYYGDISGNFRGLLNGDSEVCVVAVVAGQEIDCQRCPKRAVRRASYIDEARWNDLPENEKRRFFDCLDDHQTDIQFGYATFTKEQLHSLRNYHRLYQEQNPPVWDIAIKTYAYTEIILELSSDDERIIFYPDRFASTKQREQLETLIEDQLGNVVAQTSSSKQKPGIQTADCLAGGIREQKSGGEPWLDHLSEPVSVADQNYWALSQLEYRLSEM